MMKFIKDQYHGIITLSDFLKINDLAQTGGHAKLLITSGMVKLNGVIETRRGKKLADGDVIEIIDHHTSCE